MSFPIKLLFGFAVHSELLLLLCLVFLCVCLSIHQHEQMRTLCPNITLHSFFVPNLWLKITLIVLPRKSFHFIALARCLLFRTEHPAFHPLFLLFQVSKGCSHPEFPALIHENAGVKEKLIQSLSQDMRIVDNQIITEQEDTTCTEDSQITEIKTLSYNQSLLTSTRDSIESIATPQKADLDDEQIRALLASPRYLPERETSAERSQIYHSEREGLMSSSFQSLNFFGTGKPVACADRYTCRTPQFHMYSHSTDHTAQMTCVHWLKGLMCAEKHSFIHASWFILCCTQH